MALTTLAPPVLELRCADLKRGVTLDIRPGVSAKLKQLDDESFRLQTGNTAVRASGECNPEFGMTALLADFNFDGWRDLALPSGTGYGGVNTFYTLYFYRPASRTFQKSRFTEALNDLNIRANLIPDPQTRTVSNIYKSGPAYVNGTLCLTPDGLDLYACRRGEIGSLSTAQTADDYDWTWFGLNGSQLAFRPLKKSGQDRSLWTVLPSRLPLHSTPSLGSSSRAYVIRGDQVEVLELRGDQKGGWAHVTYTGKGDRVSSGWVQRAALR
ncbi:SH3 domain-containing protein [Deinococcus sp. UYEF24]